MSWKKSTIGDVLSVIKNGINCEQNKNPVGNKITRIETIAKKRFDFERVGYANLSEAEKLKSQLKVGDILFSHINSPIHVGKTAIYEGEENIYHGINLLLMRTKEEIDPYFFNHFLNHLFTTGYWEENCKKSVNQASVNQKDISKVQFNYPPLPTQQTIVAKLDAIFAEIDKATAAAEANAKNAEALFQSYLKQVFSENGDDWQTVALGDVCKVISGQSPEGKYYNNNGVGLPFYQGKKDFGKVYINPPTVWTSEVTKEAIKDDILMSVRAPVGPVNISRENICIGRGLAAIRSMEKIDKAYLFHFLLSKEKELVGSSGAVFNSINKGQIEKLEIPLPPLPTQQTIIAKLDALSAEVTKSAQSYQNKVNQLVTLRQSILRQAFTGELVKE